MVQYIQASNTDQKNNQLAQKKFDGDVSDSDVSADQQQKKNNEKRSKGLSSGLRLGRPPKSFVSKAIEAGQRRIIKTIENDRPNIVRSSPNGRLQLQRASGSPNGNSLITVGRQAANPYLVNQPFTASGFRNLPPLRSRNYPIVSRPTNFINSLNTPRRASPYDRYLRR